MHDNKALLDSMSNKGAHLRVDLDMPRTIEVCHAVVPLLQRSVADIDLQGSRLRAHVARE